MKVLFSMLLICTCLFSFGQINQQTIQRQHLIAAKEFAIHPLHIERFVPHGSLNKLANSSPVLKDRYTDLPDHFKPQTKSMYSAFRYYDNLRNKPDYSSFITLGYSLLSGNKYIVNAQPESLRFAPADKQ